MFRDNLRLFLGATALMAMAAGPFPMAQASNVSKGQALYEEHCAPCHQPDVDEVGPRHRGVYGRKAGSLVDYPFSDEMKNSGVTWDNKSLDKFLKNPEAFIPDNSMGFEGLPKKNERYHLIQYLKSLK